MFLALADLRDRRDVLVYLVQWQGLGWAPSGPPRRRDDNRRSVTVTGQCNLLIDATTGASLLAQYTGSERS